MTEKSYYTKLTKFYRSRALATGRTIVWEAKFTRTNVISFKALAPHQELSMLEAERAYGLKLADVGRAKKPFDGLALYDAKPVFVAIYFREKKSTLYEIDLRRFIELRQYTKKKSLTQADAAVIGVEIHI